MFLTRPHPPGELQTRAGKRWAGAASGETTSDSPETRAGFRVINVNRFPEASRKIWLVLPPQAGWDAAGLWSAWKRLGMAQDLRLSVLPPLDTLCCARLRAAPVAPAGRPGPRLSGRGSPGVASYDKHKAVVYRPKTDCPVQEAGGTA